MSNYSTLSHSTGSHSLRLERSLFQLSNICYDTSTHQVIGGELSVLEYDRLYDEFMVLHQSSRGSIPHNFYDLNGGIQIDIAEIIEDPELFIALSRDKRGSQFIQQKLPKDPELIAFLCDFLLELDLIFPLSKDVFGNFVIQKLLDVAEDYADDIFSNLLPHFLFMCKNRYSCRVAQKMISVFPAIKVKELLMNIRGHEIDMVIDAHASHVIQKVVTTQSPSVFGFIVNAITSHEKYLKKVILDKYGCRVVQICLDRIVPICQKSHRSSFVFNLLHKLLNQIIKNSLEFSKDEFANYVIQYIITSDFLAEYRQAIIRNVILNNVLLFAKERFASHVLEKALIFASPNCFSAMIHEIFNTYQIKRSDNRDTLYVMLFDQFGNYVVQRLLEVLIEVKNGNRAGDPKWFNRLAKRLIENEENLLKYSSGKKILEALETEIGPFSEYEIAM